MTQPKPLTVHELLTGTLDDLPALRANLLDLLGKVNRTLILLDTGRHALDARNAALPDGTPFDDADAEALEHADGLFLSAWAHLTVALTVAQPNPDRALAYEPLPDALALAETALSAALDNLRDVAQHGVR